MKVRNHLKEFRTRRRISQTEMARLLGVSRQAIHGFESSDYIPSLDVAARIGGILNVPVSCLFSPEFSAMHTPVALIVDCGSQAERDALGKQLYEVAPEQLQTVVKSKEGSCPIWSWDPQGKILNAGKLGIAVACTSRRQFDELRVWFRQHGQGALDCGIGMDRFPTLAYFAADSRYARESLPELEFPDAQPLPPVPDIDELVLDEETLRVVLDAFTKANLEAIRFADRCYITGNQEYGHHYSVLAKKKMLELRDRMHDGQHVKRWSSDYSLLVEALHAAEVQARNADRLDLAVKFYSARMTVEKQA